MAPLEFGSRTKLRANFTFINLVLFFLNICYLLVYLDCCSYPDCGLSQKPTDSLEIGKITNLYCSWCCEKLAADPTQISHVYCLAVDCLLMYFGNLPPVESVALVITCVGANFLVTFSPIGLVNPYNIEYPWHKGAGQVGYFLRPGVIL